MNEKLIEKKLRATVKKLDGIAIKFFCPFFTGLPDRLILMPQGRIWFAEIKTTGESLSPRQRIVWSMLTRLGFNVRKLDSETALQNFLEEIAK